MGIINEKHFGQNITYRAGNGCTNILHEGELIGTWSLIDGARWLDVAHTVLTPEHKRYLLRICALKTLSGHLL